MRESLMEYNSDKKLKGVVEIDGVYVGNYIRPKNNINDRIDRRKAYKPNKRVVLSLEQRANYGSNLTKTFILKSENSLDIKKIAKFNIDINSEIHTDENSAYDDLVANYNLKRVNHQKSTQQQME
ncbi:MAG: transposase [Campylobacter ureolyticus]|nr:transposase [Campylobacter ureolyticus]MDU7070931.1 transposase [Campylobacter ureolyticus]